MRINSNQPVLDCSTLQNNQTLEVDVVVIGTGAGGGISAQIFAEAGLKVLMIEEGSYQTTADFRMQESEAYPHLYQEVSNRKTNDKAITILQGRAVGGGTTVNWSSCFRIPTQTLAHWQQEYGWKLDETALAPSYKYVEDLLNIHPWHTHNPSNAVLVRGAKKLRWHYENISRNVRGCRSLGYCGLGCPVGAKQSTLVTSIPAALTHGAMLYSRLRAHRLIRKGDAIKELECHAMTENGSDITGIKVHVQARHFVLAAGGIGSPALLLRSRLPDPHSRVGKRTFLHVTAGTTALMPEKIKAYYGAPQSASSNEFLWRDGVSGEMGYKIETAPLHPVLAATVFGKFGQLHADVMENIPHAQPLIAIMRDGFHEQSPGGTVRINGDGSPVLDYPLNDYTWRAVRRAYASLLEIQFAAGAKEAAPLHSDAQWIGSWKQVDKAIKDLPMSAHRPKLFSAHVMGGCAMSDDPHSSVVGLDACHHHVSNLSIIDGSIFPTSVGANPSLPIYVMAAVLAKKLLPTLTSDKNKV
jgi:choline dehydrogenase-like flavoprotein